MDAHYLVALRIKKIEMLYFLHFVFFSLIGWLYESLICSIASFGKFKNRGVLLGPIIPIYGLGATACYIAFEKINSFFLVVILSGFSCCVLEYIVGGMLEKTFHKRFWDYSEWAFNIKGRTSLYCLVFFGIAVAMCIKFVDPLFFMLASKIDSRILESLSVICSIYLVLDSFSTLVARLNSDKNFVKTYFKVQEKIDMLMEKTSDKIIDAVPDKIIVACEKVQTDINVQSKKIKEQEEKAFEWIHQKNEN